MIQFNEFWRSERNMGSLNCKTIDSSFFSRYSSNDSISYGGAFVECSLQHPSEVEIAQLVFRINEVNMIWTPSSFANRNVSICLSEQGALISACRDNYIHLWNLRQKKPVIANSLRFVKEKYVLFWSVRAMIARAVAVFSSSIEQSIRRTTLLDRWWEDWIRDLPVRISNGWLNTLRSFPPLNIANSQSLERRFLPLGSVDVYSRWLSMRNGFWLGPFVEMFISSI